MTLNIKNKLIMMTLVAVLFSVGGLSFVAYFEMTGMAETYFSESSSGELQQVDRFITLFMKEAQLNAKFIATDKRVEGAVGAGVNFVNDNKLGSITRAVLGEEGKILYDFFEQMVKSHPAYGNIYTGMEDGTFIMAPGDKMPQGYDPRKRPWYREAENSLDETSFSKAYKSTTGDAVSTITAKIKKDGSLIGIVGIDINLSTLTDVVSAIKVGKTGYVMLMEADNTILSDPVHKDYLFKQADKVDNSGLTAVAKLNDGVSIISLDGKETFVRIYTSPHLGWKLALLIDKSEIMGGAYNTLKDTFLIGFGIALVLCVVGWIVARSIATPIQLLVSAAHDVSNGKYDVELDESNFSGELLTLQQSLKNMVDNLVTLLKSTEEKGIEAERQTELAKDALADAEVARNEAENAKREGMLQAAGHLEKIVAQVSSATQELSSQIEESRSGADVQRERTTEAATAMEEMNASVFEVAQNASKAAESADIAKNQAEVGGKIVHNVISSIGEVHEASGQMSIGLEGLGQQAEGIGNVMNVITDIADQTNLLALNAAIEAARAGDAGRGFAVVADEVRKLAEKTMDATKEVGDAVAAIQTRTRDSISDMARASGMIETSTQYASEAGESLSSIVEVVDDTADQVRAIATASEEQSAASEEINRTTDDVNRIAAETSYAMEESSQAVMELSRLTEELNSVIEDLKKV
ncbi:methyl-accepting chemotaxis protein [Maridesulfovibrio zosterae]|uniref:methyl-accepting chemotaxis protein n=1 Tax=Maridesulfovibrio zosterae TaxID=82171 RepID=UPI0004186A6F|nr:methyl-accepting chemotaxis protein [Maridesulfovibrio zosterae]